MSLYKDINSKMQGRVALLSEEEASALADMVKGPGDHIDLGTLWGGTAILAALAKREAGSSGHVYTVDYMQGGYWQTGDPSVGMQKPSEAAIHDNLARFDVAKQVSVVKADTHPWPLPDVTPTSVLIDCDHSYEGCKRDWKKVRSLAPEYVAFHDYNAKTHPGVARVVDEIIQTDADYRLVKKVGTLIIFKYVVPVKAKPEPEKPVKVVEETPAPVQAPKAPVRMPVKPARVTKGKRG